MLHTQGESYILNEIDLLIKKRQKWAGCNYCRCRHWTPKSPKTLRPTFI